MHIHANPTSSKIASIASEQFVCPVPRQADGDGLPCVFAQVPRGQCGNIGKRFAKAARESMDQLEIKMEEFVVMIDSVILR